MDKVIDISNKIDIYYLPIFVSTSILLRNQGGGLHWEQGGRADEVEVLLAFSHFLKFLTICFFF